MAGEHCIHFIGSSIFKSHYKRKSTEQVAACPSQREGHIFYIMNIGKSSLNKRHSNSASEYRKLAIARNLFQRPVRQQMALKPQDLNLILCEKWGILKRWSKKL
ncbi:hypothetical protein ACN6MS_03910 [Bacillus licheniformis]